MLLPLGRSAIVTVAALAIAARPAWAQTKASAEPVTSRRPTWVQELKARNLFFPVAGQSIDGVSDNFAEPRNGQRMHHALDIPAPRGTPVLSADSGRVLKLHQSRAGGLMIYACDTDGRFIYYYAHLDRYRPGITEGMTLARGDTLGYVGTTGNAPANTPHLHFAILRARDVARWSRGTPINPFTIFAR